MTPRLLPGCVIALLGACAAERDALAQALAARLNQRGIGTTLIAEPLAADADETGHEADGTQRTLIAARLHHRIGQAAARGVVVAAGTPLDVLARAPGLAAGHGTDAALADALSAALAAQGHWAMTLLVGIDSSPAIAPNDALAARDARLRTWLLNAGVGFSVVHGDRPQRLASAWGTIVAAHGASDIDGDAPAPADASRQRWGWNCDRCSDAACEHQLFTSLLTGRGGSGR